MVEKNLAIPNSEGTVDIPSEFLEGMSFIRYRMDKDRGLFVNSVSGEEKVEIYARICGVKLERVSLLDGQLLCASRDTKTSKDGVLCAVCPKMNNSPFMTDEESKVVYEKACQDAGLESPPAYAPKREDNKYHCTMRMVVQWIEEFEKDANGNFTWIQQPGLCSLSCASSSIIAMTSRGTGYLSKLKSKGYGDLRYVVTAIRIGSRKNEKTKMSYSYETFDMAGLYKDIIPKTVNFEEMKDNVAYLEQLAGEVATGARKQAELPSKGAPASNKVVDGSAVPEKPKEPAKPAQTTPPAPKAPETPPPAPKEPPKAEMSPIAMKLRIKAIYGKLPPEIQVIVMGVLKEEVGVEDLDNIPDKSLKMSYETLESAAKEVGVTTDTAEKPAEAPATPAAGAPAATAKPAGPKRPW